MSRQATGLRAWVVQRLSASYLALFFPCLIGYFLLAPPSGYEEWRGFVASPVISIGALLFFVSLLLHAWVGMRDILMDYLHPPALRLTALTLIGFGLLACGLWAMQVIFLARV
jgi:succinate dehydrogenase / fumarate reductase membrane anchor subunit